MVGKKYVLVGAAVLTLLASSAWATGQSSPVFISGNPAYEADTNNPGAMIYRKPDLNTAAYTKVLIDPIEVWVDKDSEYQGLSADESKAIADSLRQTLIKALEPDYPVVNEPGPGVLGIRLAVTHVFMKNKKRGLLGYTPVGLVVTTAGNLAGMRMQLSQATIEAELLDGGTNEQLVALIEPLGDEKAKVKLTWDEVNKRLELYAKRLRARLDEGKNKMAQ